MYSLGDESSRDSQSNRSIHSRSNNSSRQSSQPLEMISSSQVTLSLSSSTTITAIQTNNAIKTSSRAKQTKLYLVIDSSILNTSPTINELIHKEFFHIQDIAITNNGMISRQASTLNGSSVSDDQHDNHHLNAADNSDVVDLAHSDDDALVFSQSSTINPPHPPPPSSASINTSNQSDRYEFFTIDRGDSMIRWTRQPLHHIIHDNGSSSGSGSGSSSSRSSNGGNNIIAYEPYSMQLVDNNAFIDLMLQSSDGVEFDALLDHFNYSNTRSANSRSSSSSARSSSSSSSRSSSSRVGVGIHSDDNSSSRYDDDDDSDSPVVIAGNNAKERIMIVLVGIDKSAFNRQKKLSQQSSTTATTSSSSSSSSSSTIIQASISISDWIDASITYLMYEAGIQVTRCKTPLELCDYINAVTRLVGHQQMEEELITEIDCVHKANKEKPPDSLSYAEKENFELRQTWCAMLQMIPLASKDKAQAFVSFNEGMYSCPSKLYHTIYDTSISASSSSSSSSSSGVGRQARNNIKRSRKPSNSNNNNNNNNNNQGHVSINYGTSVVSTSTTTTNTTTTMMRMATMINGDTTASNSTVSTQTSTAVAITTVGQRTVRQLQSRNEDVNAFQSCFGSNKQGVVKNQSKLSRHVFNLMTATDPHALINDI